MSQLTRSDLWSLEEYAERRNQFRQQVMAHKKNRQVFISEHARLCFEDRLTIQYQIQEMLRIERIFEAAAIQEELDTYNPLIPDGSNLKATFMLEYENVVVRQEMLVKLKGIDKALWLKVDDQAPIYAIANEDLDRENEEKTSSVHFVRFEFNPESILAIRRGGRMKIGVSHQAFTAPPAIVSDEVNNALRNDFNGGTPSR